MGTNYYAYEALDYLHEAGTTAEVNIIHLGKLSSGCLPTLPFDNVYELFETINQASFIMDEYGRTLSKFEVIGRFVAHARWSSENGSQVLDSDNPEHRVGHTTVLFDLLGSHARFT